jgi:flagellar basal body-associated protein FliL
MMSKCCEFLCLDKKEHEKSAFSTFHVISLLLLCIILILAGIWCGWRRKQIRAELEKRIAAFKSKRNQQIVEEVSPSSPTTAFVEEKEKDIYVRMSVDMLRKSEVIDELKKKICVLEDKLEDSEENTRRNSRNSEIILRSHEESWKNLYDMNVDYATIND